MSTTCDPLHLFSDTQRCINAVRHSVAGQMQGPCLSGHHHHRCFPCPPDVAMRVLGLRINLHYCHVWRCCVRMLPCSGNVLLMYHLARALTGNGMHVVHLAYTAAAGASLLVCCYAPRAIFSNVAIMVVLAAAVEHNSSVQVAQQHACGPRKY